MPPEVTAEEARARSFWSGTISFGLVSVPVNLFPANRPERMPLRMLDKDGTPLRRRYYCPKDEQELDWDEIVRGYEVDDGKYVVVTDEELQALEPQKSRDIDLRRFVPLDDIDPMFFERAYYLAPAGESAKAYRLLAEVMERSARAGIATFVMRDKEYLVAIIAEHGILRAEVLRFQDELHTTADVGLAGNGKKAKRPKVSAQQVRKIEQAITKHTEERFSTRELRDTQMEKLRALIERKRRRKEDVVEAPAAAVEEARETRVIDLMEVLKQSMRAAESGEREARPKRRRAA